MSELSLSISINVLMHVFGCDRNHVTQRFNQGLEPVETCEGHLSLDADIEDELLLWIEANAAKSIIVTGRDIDIHAYVENQYYLIMLCRCVNSFMN
jgi:hypothetical protein